MSSAPVNRTVNIFINQASAEQSLQRLQAQSNKLTEAIKKGQAAGKDMTTELAKLETINSKIQTLNGVLDGTLSPTFQQVKSRVEELRRSLEGMSKDAPEYAAKFQEFTAVNTRFQQMKVELRGVNAEIENGKTKSGGLLTHISALVGGYLSIHTALRAVTGAIHIDSELSDSFAQLQIYLHGTQDDVDKLVGSLKQLDTRTSLTSLVDIATIVAKKGVAKSEITGVTQALDQLFTVLGSEAGDPHEAIASMVKLVNVYSEDKHVTAKNIGDIGAAIQKLTSSGVATGKFLIDFAERMGGVRGITGITIQSVLGLGAALEELGQRNESAATAAQKLIVQMFLKPTEYAKAAGMTIEQFTKQLSKDPIEALIKVAGALKQTGGAPAELIESFTEMGVTGARVIGVLGDIAGNADYMRKRANDASKAFGDQASIVAANEIKQRTLAATLDRVKKNFELIAASKGVQITLGAIGTAVLFLTNNLPLLIGLGVALLAGWVAQNVSLIALNAQLLYYTVMQRGLQVLYGLVSIAQAIYTAGLVVLTRTYALATPIVQAFNTVMAATPLGAVILLVTTLAAAGVALYGVISANTKATKQLSYEQQLNHDINKKANEAIADQMAKEKTLLAVINDKTAGLSNQNRALKDLKEMSNGYLNNLTLENINTKEGVDLLKQYNQQLLNKAAYEAATQLQKDKLQKDLELQETEYKLQTKLSNKQTDISDLTDDEKKYVSGFRRAAPFTASVGDLFRNSNATKDAIAEVRKQRAELAKDLDITNKIVAEKYKALGQTIEAGPTEPTSQPAAATRSIAQIADELKRVTKELKAAAIGTDEYNRLLAKQKELQDELTHAKGKKTAGDRAEDAAEKKAQRALEKRKEIDAEFAQLRADVQAADDSADQAQLQKVTDKFTTLAAKARKYAVTLSGLSVVQQQALNTLIEKQFDKRSEKEYDQSLKDLTSFYNQQRQINDQNYLDGKISRQEHANKMRQLDTDESTDRVTIANDYAATVKKAANDLEKFKTDVTQKGIKERESLEEQDLQGKVADAQRKVIIAPTGSQAELEAQRALLKAKFDLDTQYLDQRSAAYKLKEAELNKSLKDLDKQHTLEMIAIMQSAFSQISNVVTSYYNVVSQNENTALEADRNANDVKKQQLQKSLDSKRISQQQYNVQVANLDAELAKKQHDLQLKQFERQQSAAIIQAIMNGAQGVTQIWSQYGANPVFAGILTGIEAAAVLSQIGIIKKQKPPAYRKGTKNAKGGFSLVSEDGPEIVKTRDGDVFLTPDQPSYMNIPAGAEVIPNNEIYGQPRWMSSAPSPINYQQISDTMLRNRISFSSNVAGGSGAMNWTQFHETVTGMSTAMEALNAQLKDGIRAYMFWNDWDKMNKQVQNLKKIGSKNPY